jgi:hypothetical protein
MVNESKRSMNMAKHEIGETWTERKTVKGNKRDITFKSVKPFGKGGKLNRVIVSNKPAK